jgi:flagellar protein FlgJ
VQRHEAAARDAERASGIPAAFMIAQAAHESGWGRREIRHADGRPAYNLFGIKAGAQWKGPVAEVVTTEYVDGKPQRAMQKFRAYASYAESFADYAMLMKTQPRYQAVLDAGGNAQAFAQGLQRAGYATDPRYAAKLAGVIQTTMRLQQG